jgi:mRNA interferase MazF
MQFQKGEVYKVGLNPTRGEEINKIRPAVIVSNNVINSSYPTVVVCPITDATGKKSPIHIGLQKNEGGLDKESVALCTQIRSISTERLYEKIGNLSQEKMDEIDKGIQYVLF